MSLDGDLTMRLHRRVAERLSEHLRTLDGDAPLSVDDERALTRSLISAEMARLAEESYRSGHTPLDPAAESGLVIKEKRITRDEVYLADEAFFTGTAAEVTPIREVDGRTIGGGSRGKITEKLQSLYFDQVYGRRKEHPEWLAYI